MTGVLCRDGGRDEIGMPKNTPGLVAKHLGSKPPGRYGDGGGLYFHVRDTGSRAWVFRYRDRITAKLRDKGLGAYPDVSLAEAREEAAKLRATLRAGVDPIEAKREALRAAKAEHGKAKTFKYCRDAYVKAHKAGWRNAKHAQQWTNTLDTHAAMLMGMPVDAIDTAALLQVLEPIWTDKTETASRVRQRIEAVLDWAAVRGYRKGENPARWRGHLDKLLPAPTKVKTVKPHAALPYESMFDFWAKLAAMDTLASRALRLQILTATRPSETVEAQWVEFDMDANVWTIPAERMKAGKPHRVPLSKEAVALLEEMPGKRTGYLFPGEGRKPGPMTTAATLKVAKELRAGLTGHGFRSTFRDWAGDETAYPREIAEAALAHTIKDKSEAAYRRQDALLRRSKLMQEWATYCVTPRAKGATVTPIRKKSGKAG